MLSKPKIPLQPFQQQYAGIDREAIWLALFQHLQATQSELFVTLSRKHIMPPELSFEAQPAMFLVQGKEQRTGSMTGMPNKLALHGFVIVYLPSPDTNELPGEESDLAATDLNIILQALDNALVPDNLRTGKFTLGGLVTHCWIEGEVDQDPGIFTSQAAAIIPIHILVP